MATSAAMASIISEPMLRLLFRQAPGFTAVVQEPAHTFVLVNDSFLQLTGPREVIGKPVRVALPELEGQGFYELLDAVYASGEPYVAHAMPLRIRPAPGAPLVEHYVDFVYQPLCGPDGKSAGIFVQGSDVTERVVAQRRVAREAEALDAQRRLFDTVLSSIEDFAYAFDRNLRFTYINRPLLALWQLKFEDAVGKRFSELDYEPALAARLEAELETVFETGRQHRGETFYRGASGEEGWFEYIFNPVFAVDGRDRSRRRVDAQRHAPPRAGAPDGELDGIRAQREERGAACEPPEGRVPRDAEPRTAHAAERDPRLVASCCAAAASRPTRCTTRPSASAAIRARSRG